jgi:hypothetical protein
MAELLAQKTGAKLAPPSPLPPPSPEKLRYHKRIIRLVPIIYLLTTFTYLAMLIYVFKRHH